MFCGLVYIVGFIAGYVTHLPLCFTWQTVYRKLLRPFVVIVYNFVPTIFMAVVYYKIGRAVGKQSKHMKRICSDAVRKRHVRNRRIFLVCLSTFLCFGIGNFPIFVWYIFTLAVEYNSIKKYVWMNMQSLCSSATCWFILDKSCCYIASVNTKRDWLICSHVALDKCNVSRLGNK
jgi:hypothetical protein